MLLKCFKVVSVINCINWLVLLSETKKMKLPNPLSWIYCAKKDEGNDAPQEVSTLQRLFPQVWLIPKNILPFSIFQTEKLVLIDCNGAGECCSIREISSSEQTYPRWSPHNEYAYNLLLCAHDLFTGIMYNLFSPFSLLAALQYI